MLLTAYRFFAYYGTLAAFAVMALVFNGCCLLLRRGSDPLRRERAIQRAIHRLFRRVLQWGAFLRLVEIEYRGFEQLPIAGRVIVANHPGLLDAIYLLARLPAAICVFKPAVRRNPLFGPAAVRAGYLAADRPLELIRAAAAKVAAGATLLVFPEGTRTSVGATLGAFRPGFASIARRAQAPVQLVRITADPSLLTKAHAWWRLPRLPARVRLEAGPCLDPAASSTADLVGQAEAWFRRPAAESDRSEFGAFPARSSSFTLPA